MNITHPLNAYSPQSLVLYVFCFLNIISIAYLPPPLPCFPYLLFSLHHFNYPPTLPSPSFSICFIFLTSFQLPTYSPPRLPRLLFSLHRFNYPPTLPSDPSCSIYFILLPSFQLHVRMLYTVSVVLFKQEKYTLHEYLFIQQEIKSRYGLKGCVLIINKVYTKHEGGFRLVSKYCCRFYKIRNVKL